MIKENSPAKKARIVYFPMAVGRCRFSGTQAMGQWSVSWGGFRPNWIARRIYPPADIPSVQLSLLRGLDPAAHIALGKALRELLHENILVVGSGFSFHNMGAFSFPRIPYCY